MAIELLDIPENLKGYVWKRTNIREMSKSHRHEELEINLILKGHGEYILQEGRYKLVPGTMVWLFPGQEHILSHVSDDFTMLIAVFKHSLLSDYIPYSQKLIFRDSAKGEELELCRIMDQHHFQKVQYLFDECLEDLHDSDLFNMGLTYLLFKCRDAYTKSHVKAENTRFHSSVEKALSLIRDYRGNIEIDELSRRSGLSRSQLSRQFKKQTGTSLCQMKNYYRLQYYLNLRQQNPEQTLLYSSMEAGFGSYAQFHRIYRNRFGHSPGDE